jgi:hypothetical protein
MFMGMPLDEMKPETERHEGAGDEQLRRDRLAQKQDRDDRAWERREREISAGPRAAEMTQRQHKQHETDADAKESDDNRPSYCANWRQSGARASAPAPGSRRRPRDL